jgi:hypothetical protein
MADQPSVPSTRPDRARQPQQPPSTGLTPAEPGTGMPRWVKVFAIVGAVLVLLVIVMLLAGHGPGRHMRGGLGGDLPPAGATGAGGALVTGRPAW